MKKCSFLVIGRIPHEENTVGLIKAKDLAEAQKKFADELWNQGQTKRERRDTKRANGVDHYLDFIIEVEGRYRILMDDWGEKTKPHEVPWVDTRKRS